MILALAMLVGMLAGNWVAAVAVVAAALGVGRLVDATAVAPVRDLGKWIDAGEDGDPPDLSLNAPRPFNRIADALNEGRRERRRRKEDAQAAEERLAAILDGMAEGVVLLDGPEVMYANAAAVELLGVERTRLTVAAALPSSRLLALVERGGGRDEVPLDGRRRVLDAYVRRVPNTEGGSVLVLRDVTERRERERRERAFRQSATHEIKTPLAVIRAALEAWEPGEDSALRDVATTEVDRLAGMVGDLLLMDVGRGGAQQSDMGEVWSEIEGPLTALAARHGLELVGPGPAKSRVPLGPRSLGAVLRALVENAIVYHDKESGGTVWICPTDGGFAVEDDGPGIPEEEIPRLSEPFERGATDRGHGTGLGLAVCLQVVADAGGRLTLGKREGGGLSVRVEF